MRLNQYLARNGFGSRRSVEPMIQGGRVTLNGQIARDLWTQVDEVEDEVCVDGQLVKQPENIVYRYYKPRGIVSTLSDERGRHDLSQVSTQIVSGCKPAGRLDKDSEGLILWTNNRQWLQLLMSPTAGVGKIYHVSVDGAVSSHQIKRLLSIERLPDGQHLRHQASISIKHQRLAKTILEVVLHEGKNRQIRQMCESVGLNIRRLVRYAQADVSIKGLKPGQIQPLSNAAFDKFSRALTLLQDD